MYLEQFIKDEILSYNETMVMDFEAVVLEDKIDYSADISSKKHGNKYVFKVNPNDNGRIPHFHVNKCGGGKEPKANGCLKLDTAEIFNHNSSLQLEFGSDFSNLQKFLQQKNSKNKDMTNWQVLQAWWNKSDNRIKSAAAEQPDYSNIFKK